MRPPITHIYIVISFGLGLFDNIKCHKCHLSYQFSEQWEARKAVSPARRTPRRPDIYAYVKDLGIDPSLIRSRYELPIDTVASSRKNKSLQGITIRTS